MGRCSSWFWCWVLLCAAGPPAFGAMQYCITSNGDLMAYEMGDPDSPFRIDSGATPPSSKQAKINFGVTYNDIRNNTNRGFDDPALGSARRAVVDRVIEYVNSVLDESGAIDIVFEQSITTNGTQFLATAGPLFQEDPGFTNGFPFDRLVGGTDPNGPNEAELFAQVNFSLNWFTGTGTPSDDEFDLFSVLLHEITHGLGMLSFTDPDGSGSFANPETYSVFDSYLLSVRGNVIADLRTPTFLGTEALLTSGALFFAGPSATRAFGREPEIFAPNPFLEGSSLSHFDPSLGDDLLMSPSISRGEMNRRYSDFELAAMADLGYRIDAAQVCMVGDTPPVKRDAAKAVFGVDDRRDVRSLSSQDSLRRITNATVAVVEASQLSEEEGGARFQLETFAYRPNGRSLCADEPFVNQRTAALCSGVLVAGDIVAIAGSCLEFRDLDALRFVFGFELTGSGLTPTVLEPEQVYSGIELIGQEYDSAELDPTGLNYAVVRLDRVVAGVTPVEIRSEGEPALFSPLGIAGHPSGLPTKIATGRAGSGASPAFTMEVVANCSAVSFFSNVDGYAGSFGAPVFNPITLVVEGLFSGGVEDFLSVPGENCQLSRVVANFGGEQLSTKTTVFSSMIPPALNTLAHVSFNRPTFVCGDEIGIRVADLNAGADAVVEVMVVSMNPDGEMADAETVTLTKGDPGMFSGNLSTSPDATDAGDGVLSLVDAGSLIAMHEDPDDGNGAPVTVSAGAGVVCSPWLELSPASLDFGKVFAGERVERTLRLANRGTGTLSGTVSTFAPFAIVSGGAFELQAGAEPQEVRIAYRPSVSGTFDGDVVIVAGGDVTVPVQGLSFAPISDQEPPMMTGCAMGAGDGAGWSAWDRGMVLVLVLGFGFFRIRLSAQT